MNLHRVVRGAITTVNPDATVLIYYAIGQENTKGKITPLYDAPQTIQAQWQPLDLEYLRQTERVSDTIVGDQVFLYSDPNKPVSGIKRIPLARTGDFLKKGDQWYLVTGIIEDWSDVGWINIDVTLQAKPPEGISDV